MVQQSEPSKIAHKEGREGEKTQKKKKIKRFRNPTSLF